MPRTPAAALTTHPRPTGLIAITLAIGLVVGAIHVLSPAGAESRITAQVASATDAGAVDLNRDGVADLTHFGAKSRSLSVGEQLRDGSDLRLFLPFTVSPQARAAVIADGGSANVTIRVHRSDNLAARKLVIDTYTNGTAATKSDYRRRATRLATISPVKGRIAVDVSPVVRSMRRPGSFTLRLRLNRPASRDGAITRVSVATSESLRAENRPTLSVSAPGGVTDPPQPPVTAPPTPPTTTKPVPPPTTVSTVPTTDPPAPTEIFRDDFNGSTLDLSKWRPNWLAGTDDAITKPVNSAELSCYDPAQVSVSGGSLHLRAVNRSCRANNGTTYPYASGLVESAHDFTFTYGRIEARIFVPGSGAAANWPAFWANGTGTWPVTGELDVMEGLDGHACWHFHSTAGGPGGCAPWADPTGWHTFAADWEPGSVTYFYDGVQVGRIASGITAAPMYLILNLGLSTEIAPPVQLPSEMLVDWVRVTR